MENSKKLYNIFLNYDENKNLDVLMIDVNSEDPIYKKSSFILYGKEDLERFRIFLRLALIKKLEWDSTNLINNEDDIVKKMDLEKEMQVTCIYDNGPSFSESNLSSTYVYLKGRSALSISTTSFGEVERSQIFFIDNTSIKNFINKLEDKSINSFIISDFNKKARLK